MLITHKQGLRPIRHIYYIYSANYYSIQHNLKNDVDITRLLIPVCYQTIMSDVLHLPDSHLFSMNWCRRQDLPVPAFPITKNLNRKSAKREQKIVITLTTVVLL